MTEYHDFEASQPMTIEEQNFQRFRHTVEKAVQALGLTDWNIEVRQQLLSLSDHETIARTGMNWTARTARILWNINHIFDADSLEERTPEHYAWHEVMHIALNAFMYTAYLSKDIDSDNVIAEEHALIRRLMKALGVN